MATDQTYTEIQDAFRAVAGISVMESTDKEFFFRSLNRAANRAWSESEIWPRYLVRNEQRTVTPYSTYNIVPYTETGLDTIAEFHRMWTADPWARSTDAIEVEFMVDSTGARIINPSSGWDDVLWVTYKKVWDGPYTESSTTIPEEFADYLIHSILADFYTGDGQTEKSVMHEQRADGYLNKQLARLSYTNRNPYKFGSMMTHTNNQRRF